MQFLVPEKRIESDIVLHEVSKIHVKSEYNSSKTRVDKKIHVKSTYLK